MIPSQSQGSPGGFIYTWEDRADLAPGTSYFYWVEDVDVNGATTMHGPVSVDFSVPTAVEVTDLAASSSRAVFPGWPAGLAALLGALSSTILLTWRRRKKITDGRIAVHSVGDLARTVTGNVLRRSASDTYNF